MQGSLLQLLQLLYATGQEHKPLKLMRSPSFQELGLSLAAPSQGTVVRQSVNAEVYYSFLSVVTEEDNEDRSGNELLAKPVNSTD